MTPLLLVVPWMLAAPVPKDFKTPEQVLTGTWEFVESSFNGVPEPSYLKVRWMLKKDGTAVKYMSGSTEPIPAAYKFDATQKPKHFDWTIHTNTFNGIYELQGDTLKVALSLVNERPTEFGGKSVYIFTMKRVK